MLNYEIDKRNPYVTWIKVLGKNAKQETMTIELLHCDNPGGKNSPPYLWHKDGFTDRIMETYIGCNTYVDDSEGGCRGAYNPQEKLSGDGMRNVIDFDWLFEDTEENRKKLVEECIRRFESATGKSATELKLERIYKYAKEKEMEVATEMPEGWFTSRSMCVPLGSERIVNTKPFMRVDGKLIKNPDYKEMLLIL